MVEDVEHVVLEFIAAQALELSTLSDWLLHVLIAVFGSESHSANHRAQLTTRLAAFLHSRLAPSHEVQLIAGLLGLANFGEDGVAVWATNYSLWTMGQGGGETAEGEGA